MSFARIFCIMLMLTPIIGCSVSGVDSKSLWASALKSFNDGDFQGSLRLANELRNYDDNAGKFLVSQIDTLEAMKHGGAFPLLKNDYEGASSLQFSDLPNGWQARFFAAKIFAEIYSQGKDRAMVDFSDGCILFKKPVVESCIKYLSDSALSSYTSTKQNIDRVYLSNVSYISARLDVGDRSIADFGIAMSLVGIDDLRSGSIARDLRRRGSLDKRKIGLYCNLVSQIAAAPNSASECHRLSE